MVKILKEVSVKMFLSVSLEEFQKRGNGGHGENETPKENTNA